MKTEGNQSQKNVLNLSLGLNFLLIISLMILHATPSSYLIGKRDYGWPLEWISYYTPIGESNVQVSSQEGSLVLDLVVALLLVVSITGLIQIWYRTYDTPTRWDLYLSQGLVVLWFAAHFLVERNIFDIVNLAVFFVYLSIGGAGLCGCWMLGKFLKLHCTTLITSVLMAVEFVQLNLREHPHQDMFPWFSKVYGWPFEFVMFVTSDLGYSDSWPYDDFEYPRYFLLSLFLNIGLCMLIMISTGMFVEEWIRKGRSLKFGLRLLFAFIIASSIIFSLQRAGVLFRTNTEYSEVISVAVLLLGICATTIVGMRLLFKFLGSVLPR